LYAVKAATSLDKVGCGRLHSPLSRQTAPQSAAEYICAAHVAHQKLDVKNWRLPASTVFSHRTYGWIKFLVSNMGYVMPREVSREIRQFS
jgi:hypothetical protein